ncbi:MAG: hypothetical protein ACRCX5_12250 [Bacteroidales bacterium]
MNLNEIFEKDGSFKVKYSPYNLDEDNKEHLEFHKKIFDESGSLKLSKESINDFIRKNNCKLHTSIFMCYYGDEMDEITDGSSPCIYMWK